MITSLNHSSCYCPYLKEWLVLHDSDLRLEKGKLYLSPGRPAARFRRPSRITLPICKSRPIASGVTQTEVLLKSWECRRYFVRRGPRHARAQNLDLRKTPLVPNTLCCKRKGKFTLNHDTQKPDTRWYRCSAKIADCTRCGPWYAVASHSLGRCPELKWCSRPYSPDAYSLMCTLTPARSSNAVQGPFRSSRYLSTWSWW